MSEIDIIAAFKLAEEEVADPVTASNQRTARGATRAYHLSRALLALRPTFEAVRQWRLVMGMEHDGGIEAINRDEQVCQALMRAIDALAGRKS